MKKLFLKTVISLALMVFMSLFCSSAFAAEKLNTFQFSVYTGVAVNMSGCDVGGLHSALGANAPTPDSDLMYASVKGMEMKQDPVWGLNGRYYFRKYGVDIGIDADLSFLSFKSPKQEVTVEGMRDAAITLGLPPETFDPLEQPEAEFNLLSFSIGPVFRYRDTGMFERFNPYISPSISFHYGKAHDVSYAPPFLTHPVLGIQVTDPNYYGKFGTSDIKGIGYGVKLGAEYFIKDNDNLGFSIEFRYTQNHLEVDNFRSYTRGLDMKTHTSSVIIGTIWRF